MTPAESLHELTCTVLQISGCGSTLLSIGKEMPNTALEDAGTFCPEIFVRSMAAEINRQVNFALSQIEDIEIALRTAAPKSSAKEGSK